MIHQDLSSQKSHLNIFLNTVDPFYNNIIYNDNLFLAISGHEIDYFLGKIIIISLFRLLLHF